MPGDQGHDLPRATAPFEGRLVRLRAIEDEDVPTINELFDDPEVLQFLAMAWPEPASGTRAWLDRTREDPRGKTFAIETVAPTGAQTVPGELVGVCSLEGIDSAARTAWLGIWIGKPFWGRGLGTDAVRTLCRLGFRELNLQRIGLQVYETNSRAKRAYEKVGFKEEGRLRRAHFVGGRHVDTFMMGLLAEDLAED